LQEQHIARAEGQESTFVRPRMQACIPTQLRLQPHLLWGYVLWGREYYSCALEATLGHLPLQARGQRAHFEAQKPAAILVLSTIGESSVFGGKKHKIEMKNLTSHSALSIIASISAIASLFCEVHQISMNWHDLGQSAGIGKEFFKAPAAPEIDSNKLIGLIFHARYLALCWNSLESILLKGKSMTANAQIT
jgi:hypothetical protein